MKLYLLAAILLVGCTTPKGVTPKPDIKPVIVSNERTKKAITQARAQTKQVIESQTKVEGSLKSVMDDLDQLLKQP